MITSIKDLQGNTRLAIVLDKYDCLENLQKYRNDLISLFSCCERLDISLNEYIFSMMSVIALLDIEIPDILQAEKDLRNRAMLVVNTSNNTMEQVEE